MLFVEENT